MADQRIQSTEYMVGAGHGSLTDTLNRLTLVSHEDDGTHKFILDATDSTTTGTGAIKTAGGIGVAKSITMGGQINKVTITAPATTAVLTLGAGKTFTINNTLTLAGTDGTTMTFPPVTASIGYINMPVSHKTDSYTFDLPDSGYLFVLDSGTSKTFTIPANASKAFVEGTVIAVYNATAAATSVAITDDTLTQLVTGSTGTRTVAAKGMIFLTKVGTTSWICSGSGVS